MSTLICISSYNVEVVTGHITAPDMLFRFLVAKRIFQGRDLYNYELAKLSDSIRQEVITSAVQKCFPYREVGDVAVLPSRGQVAKLWRTTT
jgi:hypothetical protein